MLRNCKQFGLSIAILIMIDQVIKIIIKAYYFDRSFTIIEGLFRFHPTINRNLSWGGNYIHFLSIPVVLYVMTSLVILFFATAYGFYRSKVQSASKWVNAIYIAGMAGSVCSLIDKIFWGGSLDYIQIPRLFIFDLKDCYLTFAELLIFIIGIRHSKKIRVKEYLRYCFQRKKSKTSI